MSTGLRSLASGSLAAALLISLSARRAQAEGPADPLLAAERATSEASGRSGFAAAVAEAFHPDGVLLWPGAPVAAGAADVRRLLAAQASLDSLCLTWQPLGVELSGDATLGVTWGVAVAASRSGAPPPEISRYIAAWRRDGERWTFAALLFARIGRLQATTVPAGMPLRRPPIQPTGDAGPFVVADLEFAQLGADRGAAVAFERWAAPEAVMFGGGGLLTRGPEAIGRLVAGPAAWRWHPVAAGAARSGDLGWTVGEAVIDPTEGEPVHSKYLTVWVRRPEGGTVRFLHDGGNPRPAAP